MKTLIENRREAAALIARAKEVQRQADRERRELSQEENDKILALIDEAKSILADEKPTWGSLSEAIADVERVSPRLSGTVGPGGFRPGEPIPLYPEGNSNNPEMTRPIQKQGSKRYADLFGKKQLSNGGWPDFETFLRTVHSGLADSRLLATMAERSGSTGGYFLAEQFIARLLDDALLEGEVIRPRADIVPMTGDSMRIAGFDSLDNSTGSPFGGLIGTWLGELETAVNVDAKVRSLLFKAKKLGIFTSCSNELVADSSFDRMIGGALAKSIAWNLDYYFINGNGAGEPLGILNDPAKIVVAKETGQAAATIKTENVVKMFSRLHPACAISPSACWLAHPSVTPALYLMSLGLGVSGTATFLPPGGLSGKPNSTLLGLPVIFTEKLPVLGLAGDLVCCDLLQYTITMRADATLEKSLHVGWQTDSTAYRCILRCDGMGRWSAPYKPRNGSTLSWIVTLETRS